jgi:PAS domain S-box-containing protein
MALQAVTSSLSLSETPGDVAQVVLERGIALLGARAGSISLVQQGDERLARLQARGIEGAFLRAYDEIATTEAVPAAEAVRTGRSVWLESVEELEARHPALAAVARSGDVGASVALALTVRGRPIGALTLLFPKPRRFGQADRAFAAALADACALALERATLLESERAIRARAEETARMLQDFDQFRLLVDQVKDYAIFMLDTQGNVRTWNHGAERIKGYQSEEIVGSHFSRFYPEADVRAGKPERELAIAAAEGRHEDEGIRVRKDGSTFWANVVITALRDRDGTLRGFAKVTRDISERIQAERERVRLARLEEGTRARDEFIGIASHEFKTPITTLQLATEMLLRDGTRSNATLATSKPRLRTIHRQGRRLGSLVQALIDVTQITAGRLALRREQVDLAAVVSSAMERWRDALERAECRLELRLQDSVHGYWDRARLEQVVDNLVANAVKFGAGRPVEVDVSAEPDRSSAHIAVRDHGIGISEEDQRRIFERFERAVPTRHYGGFGLGLWIVRNIVQAHGGEITVSSEPGKGSRFEVTLPARRSA